MTWGHALGTGAWMLSWPGLLTGCLVGFVDEIPCVDDEQCPSDSFCDRPSSTCLPDLLGDGGPAVAVTGVVDGNDVVDAPLVPSETTTNLLLVLGNVGGHVAVDVALRLQPVTCLSLVLDEDAVPSDLEPDEEVRVPFSVTPRLCSYPVIQDWFTSFSGRNARGTFNLLPQRSAPSGE
jgi:hypothetical protein